MKKPLLLLISICGLCLLNGCGTSAPPPPPPAIVVALSPNSAQALDVNGSDTFTATVSNDTSNQGVSWTVTCPAGVTTCGAMAQSKTASGAPNKYGAPTNVSAAEMVTVTATAVSDPSQSRSVPVTVNPAFVLVNPPPAQPQPGNVGSPFSLNLMSFVQGGTPPFIWAIKSGTLPAGLALDAGTGMVTGTPSATATAAVVSFTSTDSAIPPTSIPAAVQISLAVKPGILTITSGAPVAGTLRAQFNSSSSGFILTGSGGVMPYAWTWAAAAGSSLPPGLAFSSNADNTATISGVPTTAGSYTVAVKLTDAESPAATPGTAAYTITVNAPPPLAVSPAAPPSGTVNVNYGPSKNQSFKCVRNLNGIVSCTSCPPASCVSLPPCLRINPRYPCVQIRSVFGGFTFTATGGIPPYTWTASALPPGLTLNAQNGELTGTPSLAGSYKVVVAATDSGIPPVTMNANFTIVIANPPPPVINTTPAPPSGALKLLYSFTFTATGGLPPLGSWTETGALPPGLQFTNSTGVLSGTPTAVGTSPISLMVQDAAGQNSAAQAFSIQIFAHGFSATGSMATSRFAQTATLLNTGKVLVAGGTDASSNSFATAELYDPSNGSFSPTGSMATGRAYFAAALLSNGKVLVTGGIDAAGNPLASAEIYDSSTGTFSATHGNMTIARASHTATLLNTGKVLVAGWGNATAELFDPATGNFTATGSMVTARVAHTATLLNTGKVLLTGGIQGAPPATTVLAEAELYDPTAGTFSQTTGSLATAREVHAASLLTDGKVLVTGGLDSTGKAIASAEVFDPTSQSFTATKGSMGTARSFQTSTSLKDGTVLVTGGDDGTAQLASAEVYDPTSGTFSPTGSMGAARLLHTATLLNDGRVLVTGGNGTTVLVTAEVYQ